MSAPDAYLGEMPGFPHPGRPGGEHDEPLLDMIFDGRAIPPDAPQEMHDLQRMLAALAGPAEPGELAGEATARAALILLASPAGVSPGAPRPAAGTRPRRPASHRLRGRPDPIQQVAHATVGAPAPRHHGAPWPAGSGPQRDTRHRPAPSGLSASRPDRPADVGRSPSYAHVARPRHEPSWDRAPAANQSRGPLRPSIGTGWPASLPGGT